jgi:molybdopterin synthase catalytic subunit
MNAILTNQPIRLEDLGIDSGHGAEQGAQVLFLGKVRATNAGKRVLAVSYDAFGPLAERTLGEICREAEAKCPGLTARVWHRIGRLEVGEISVAIVVSSPHRREAYEASRSMIDEIKHRAPIWKKEHYEDGETEWLQGHALCH